MQDRFTKCHTRLKEKISGLYEEVLEDFESSVGNFNDVKTRLRKKAAETPENDVEVLRAARSMRKAYYDLQSIHVMNRRSKQCPRVIFPVELMPKVERIVD